MYIDDDYDTKKKCLRMDMPSEKEFKDLSIGDPVEIRVKGTVQELEGPKEVPDYSYDPKPGAKRRMRQHPGSIKVELDNDPEMDAIKDLNDMHLAEEI